MLKGNVIQSQEQLDFELHKLKYDPRHFFRLKNDLLPLFHRFPTLHLKEDTFISNDGSSHNLLCLEGTLPIQFRGSDYFIPMNIWIPISYPLHPPLCFVVPTFNMVIRPKHKHVDSNGQCYLPYLSHWRPELSHFIGLCEDLANVFSIDPPVYAKPSTPPELPTIISPVKVDTGSVIVTHNTINNVNNSNSNNNSYVEPDPKKLITDKVILQLASYNQQLSQELTSYMQSQDQLETNAKYLNATVKNFTQEIEKAEAIYEIISKKEEEIEEWINNNEKKTEMTIDEIIMPTDQLSNSMFDLVSDDAAIEDTLYHLSNYFMLNPQSMDLDNYLRIVRSLARDQFFKRAMCKKILEAQLNYTV